MQVLHISEDALHFLIDKVIEYIDKKKIVEPDRFIDGKEAMKRLGIRSKTTLQKLRDNGDIAFSQPSRRVIMYDKLSIDEYLQKHTKHKF